MLTTLKKIISEYMIQGKLLSNDLFFSLTWFHLKIISRNSFFFFNVFLSTTSFIILQLIISKYYKIESSDLIWKRSVLIGIWSSTITSCGIIGWQPYRGTLQNLVNCQTNAIVSLICLTIPATLYGFLSIPIALIFSLIFGLNIKGFDYIFFLTCLMYFVSPLIISLNFWIWFTMTKNGMIYERLLVTPIIALSGLFYNLVPQNLFYLTDLIIVIGVPIKMATKSNYQYSYIVWMVSIFLYTLTYFTFSMFILNKLKKDNKIGVL